MQCPRCKTENPPNLTVCWQCKHDLTQPLPPLEVNPPRKRNRNLLTWVQVFIEELHLPPPRLPGWLENRMPAWAPEVGRSLMPGLAGLLSLFLPGVGQLLLGEYLRALLFLLGFAASVWYTMFTAPVFSSGLSSLAVAVYFHSSFPWAPYVVATLAAYEAAFASYRRGQNRPLPPINGMILSLAFSVFLLLVVWGVRDLYLARYTIHGLNGLSPAYRDLLTYPNCNRMVVDHRAYRHQTPQPGDLVLAGPQIAGLRYYVWEQTGVPCWILGLPGDRVELTRTGIMVKGELIVRLNKRNREWVERHGTSHMDLPPDTYAFFLPRECLGNVAGEFDDLGLLQIMVISEIRGRIILGLGNGGRQMPLKELKQMGEKPKSSVEN